MAGLHDRFLKRTLARVTIPTLWQITYTVNEMCAYAARSGPETALDNSPYEAGLVANGTHFDPMTWDEWTKIAVARAVPGAVEFNPVCRLTRREGVLREQPKRDCSARARNGKKEPLL